MTQTISDKEASVLYTVGHSNTPTETLLEKLEGWGVTVLVDVRRYPTSRWNPQFNGPVLARWLESHGVRYRHEVDLGGHRDPSSDSPNVGLDPTFQGYADHMRSPTFRQALERLIRLAGELPTAVMCAEAAPEHCHRRFLADAVVIHGLAVRHILSPSETRLHKLHPLARQDGDDLIYPPAEEAQLSLFGGS